LEFGIWNFIGNWKLEIGNFKETFISFDSKNH
jgi:hypothetical protein